VGEGVEYTAPSESWRNGLLLEMEAGHLGAHMRSMVPMWSSWAFGLLLGGSEDRVRVLLFLALGGGGWR
jgi:hypothetical protein